MHAHTCTPTHTHTHTHSAHLPISYDQAKEYDRKHKVVESTVKTVGKGGKKVMEAVDGIINKTK